MELLNVTNEVYEFYRTNVRDNQDITLDQVRRKLTRNMLLAMPVPPRNMVEEMVGNKKFIYGNLHMIIKNGTVIKLHNHYGKVRKYGGWKPDENKNIELTKELGIE